MGQAWILTPTKSLPFLSKNQKKNAMGLSWNMIQLNICTMLYQIDFRHKLGSKCWIDKEQLQKVFRFHQTIWIYSKKLGWSTKKAIWSSRSHVHSYRENFFIFCMRHFSVRLELLCRFEMFTERHSGWNANERVC